MSMLIPLISWKTRSKISEGNRVPDKPLIDKSASKPRQRPQKQHMNAELDVMGEGIYALSVR